MVIKQSDPHAIKYAEPQHFRPTAAADRQRSPWVRDGQCPAAPVLNTVLPRLDIGRRVAGHAHPGQAGLTGLHLRSVLRFASGFHPTRPRGKGRGPLGHLRPRAVASGSRLPPAGSIGDLHPQSFTHARRTRRPTGSFRFPGLLDHLIPRLPLDHLHPSLTSPPSTTLNYCSRLSHPHWHRGSALNGRGSRPASVAQPRHGADLQHQLTFSPRRFASLSRSRLLSPRRKIYGPSADPLGPKIASRAVPAKTLSAPPLRRFASRSSETAGVGLVPLQTILTFRIG